MTELPVPADILVYTQSEWEDLSRQSARMARMLADQTIWVWPDMAADER